MMPDMAVAIHKEIMNLTAELITVGLSVDQNYPTIVNRPGHVTTIDIPGDVDLSVTLKNVTYTEAYSSLVDQRAFNIKLIDGAMLQMMYMFKEQDVEKHRLAFFPSPDLLEFQNNPDIYETDEIYADMVHKGIVTSPIRIDFDKKNFVDYVHPMCHMTIGQYKGCRIPVSGPLNPFLFVNFILRSFYNTAYMSFSDCITEHQCTFNETITVKETSHLHVRAFRNSE